MLRDRYLQDTFGHKKTTLFLDADKMESRPKSVGVCGKTNYSQLLKPSNEWALNFILNTLTIHQEFYDFCPFVKHDSHLVGSSAQGLNVTSYSWNYVVQPGVTDTCPAQVLSDIDEMFDYPLVEVDQKSSKSYMCVFGYSNTRNTHPGYLRVVLKENSNMLVNQYVVKRGSKRYLCNQILLDAFFVTFGADISCHQHGPSMQTYHKMSDSILAQDTSFALRCFTWPAVEWTNRKRPSGWPSKDLLCNIASEGCHIVSKAHPISSESDAEIEFRYSFSKAEVKICRTLCSMQKHCFKQFRLVLESVLRYGMPFTEHCKLTSYHLKTVFWYVCEDIPPDDWTRDTIGMCLLVFLDRLLELLQNRNIPNYFMPENNMIDHLSEDQRLTLIWLIKDIKSNPVGHLLSLPLSQKYDQSDQYDLFRPVINILDCGNEQIRIEACVLALQNVANFAFELSETWREAKRYMSEQSLLLQKLIRIFPPTSDVALVGWTSDAKLGLQVSPSLLLSIMFVKWLRERWGVLTHSDLVVLLVHPTAYSLLLGVTNFLLAQRLFPNALSVLKRMETLSCTRDLEYLVDSLLGVTYMQLGERAQAITCARRSAQHHIFDGIQYKYPNSDQAIVEWLHITSNYYSP